MSDNHQQLIDQIVTDLHEQNTYAAHIDAQKLLLADSSISDLSQRSVQIYKEIQALQGRDVDLGKLGLPELVCNSPDEIAKYEKLWSKPKGAAVLRTEPDITGNMIERLKVPGYQKYELTPGLGHSFTQHNADGSVTTEYVGIGNSNRTTTSKDLTFQRTDALDSTGKPTGAYDTSQKNADGSTTTVTIVPNPEGLSFRQTTWNDGTVKTEYLDPKTGKLTGKGHLSKHGEDVKGWGPEPGDNYTKP